MNLKSKKDILVRNLLGSVVPIIAHDAAFERRLLERRLPVFTLKTWACHRWPSRCHKPHSIPEKLAGSKDLVEVPKTDLARCRIWETTSKSTLVRLAISGMRLIAF
jgi:hypothetical protein